MWGKTSFPPPVHRAGSGEAERGLQPAPHTRFPLPGHQDRHRGAPSPLLACVRWRTRILLCLGPLDPSGPRGGGFLSAEGPRPAEALTSGVSKWRGVGGGAGTLPREVGPHGS